MASAEITVQLSDEAKALLDALKVGARHSQADMRLVQEMHDYACKLGATCPDPSAPAPLKSDDDEVLVFGEAVKALGDGKVGGYLVRYSSAADPDITAMRDFFTPDTDFGDAEKSDVYYNHGLDRKVGKRVLGKASLRRDEFGVWAEATLQLRDEYEKFIYELARKGKLGWSSGTAPNLVDRKPVGKAHQITKWPLGLDASLTPIPAEPRNGVIALKAWLAEQAASPDGDAQPEPEGSQASDPQAEAREREFAAWKSSNVWIDKYKDN